MEMTKKWVAHRIEFAGGVEQVPWWERPIRLSLSEASCALLIPKRELQKREERELEDPSNQQCIVLRQLAKEGMNVGEMDSFRSRVATLD